MEKSAAKSIRKIEEHSVPLFWPLAAAYAMGGAELALFKRNLKFVAEAEKLAHGLEPQFATANTVSLDLHTLRLREFGAAKSSAIPTLVDACRSATSAVRCICLPAKQTTLLRRSRCSPPRIWSARPKTRLRRRWRRAGISGCSWGPRPCTSDGPKLPGGSCERRVACDGRDGARPRVCKSSVANRVT